MRKLEVRNLDDLRSFLRLPERDWSTITLLGLDLRSPGIDHALLTEELDQRTAFLGCRMSMALTRKLISLGALVMAGRPGLEFDPFRTVLYDAHELLRGYRGKDPATYQKTPDWTCYLAAMDNLSKRKRQDLSIDDAVFFRLHDLAIEEALDEYLKPFGGQPGSMKRVVGIMGGHDRERLEKTRDGHGNPTASDAPYMQVALLAWKLARAGFTVATGGGPGAMEASNLGAWFATRGEDDLRIAVRMLERVPRVKPVARVRLTGTAATGWVPPLKSWNAFRERPRIRAPRAWVCRPGSTDMNPRIPSQATSPSSSRTRSARKACSRSPPTA